MSRSTRTTKKGGRRADKRRGYGSGKNKGNEGSGENNRIVWKNLYYMLAYSIEELAHLDINKIKLERIDSIDDLLVELMNKSIELLKENNFLNDYTRYTASSTQPRGRLMVADSHKNGDIQKGKIIHQYSKFTIDSYFNQIIKCATRKLYTKGNIGNRAKATLVNILDDLVEVTDIDVKEIDMADLDYNDLPVWYKPAIVTSKLIIDNLTGKDKAGEVYLYDLPDEERLHRIFEKFVRNYLKREYKRAHTTSPIYELKDGVREDLDILLEDDETAVIIDCKWYNKTMNRKANRAQVQAYGDAYIEYHILKSSGSGSDSEKEVNDGKKMYCTVLYAETIENKEIYKSGQKVNEKFILERTINLNQDFQGIKTDIVNIVDKILEHDIEIQIGVRKLSR